MSSTGRTSRRQYLLSPAVDGHSVWRQLLAFVAVLTTVVALALGTSPVAAAAASSGSASSCPQTDNETVSTDQPSYPNFDTVHISGAGYAADCQITIKVTRPGGSVVTGDGTETPGSDGVTTDTS